MSAILLPIRLDRLQLSLNTILTDALDTGGGGPEVIWAKTEAVWDSFTPDSGLVVLDMIAGPQPVHRAGKRGTLLNAVDSIEITITDATVGQRYIVRLNDFDYRTDSVGGDTVTTIRDRLRAAINDDDLETATAADLAADGITLSADSLGGMRSLELVGPLTSANKTVDGNSVLVTQGAQLVLVNVQCFSKGREPRNGAWAIQAIVMAAFQSEDFVEELRRFGVGVWNKGPSVDISAIAGAHWETRESFDLTLAAQANWVRPISRVETLTFDFTGDGADGNVLASSTFTATP